MITIIICTAVWAAFSAVDIWYTRALRRELNEWVDRVEDAAKQLERHETRNEKL